jgi:putative transposase
MDLDQSNDVIFAELFEVLNAENNDQMRLLLQSLLNVLMKLEREEALGAKPYERSEERKGYANGFKPKLFKSRLGQLDLQIPQIRGFSFYPQALEKGSRSERALKLAVAEMYLKGVSTRRVEKVTQALCGLELSSTQVSRAAQELDEEFEKFRNRPLGIYRYVFFDALYLKIRHDGTVIDQAILMAYGVNLFGRREILGLSTSLSEAEVHWRGFLEGLVKRGLSGLKLITSDDHVGLRNALRSVFPSVKWQRCQFHMIQNALAYAPKRTLREPIAEAMKEIFTSRSLQEARERTREVAERFTKPAPEFVNWLEGNIEDGLICFLFPKGHWKRIRTTNGLERVNREVKRRTRVAVLFPNAASALRLVTGVVLEIHEEWITGKVYLNMNESEEGQECELTEAKAG